MEHIIPLKPTEAEHELACFNQCRECKSEQKASPRADPLTRCKRQQQSHREQQDAIEDYLLEQAHVAFGYNIVP